MPVILERRRNAGRWSVAVRIATAAVGGYAFANVAGIALAAVLPMERADAVFAMTLASFALYTAAVIYVFAARTAARACVGVLAPTAALGVLVWLLGLA